MKLTDVVISTLILTIPFLVYSSLFQTIIDLFSIFYLFPSPYIIRLFRPIMFVSLLFVFYNSGQNRTIRDPILYTVLGCWTNHRIYKLVLLVLILSLFDILISRRRDSYAIEDIIYVLITP